MIRLLPSSRSPRIALATLFVIAPGVTAVAESSDEPAQAIVLDFEGDGRADRAWVGPSEEAEGIYELHIYLRSRQPEGGGETPDTVLHDLESWVAPSLESPHPGMLELRTCTGCGAKRSSEEKLTIVFRGGRLIVSRFQRSWEWSDPLPEDEFNVIVGGCDVDFLTGSAIVSTGLEEETRVSGRFTPVAIEDWSTGSWPAICRIADEE